MSYMFSKWLLKQPKISTLSKTTSALYSWVRDPISSIWESITQLTSLILSGMLESRSRNRRFLSSGAWFPSTVHVIPPTWARDRCVLSIFRHSWTKWPCSLFVIYITVRLSTYKQNSSLCHMGIGTFKILFYILSKKMDE